MSSSDVPEETFQVVDNELEDSVEKNEPNLSEPQRFAQEYDICLKCYTLVKMGQKCSVCGLSNAEIRTDLHKSTVAHFAQSEQIKASKSEYE